MVGINGVHGGGGAIVMEEGESEKRGVKRQASDSDLTDISRFTRRLRTLSIRRAPRSNQSFNELDILTK